MKNNIHIDFKEGPVFYQDIFEHVGTPAHGGQAFFFGAVRDFNQGKKVVSISYEIFKPLALNTLTDICQQAQKQWGEDLNICTIHSFGNLKIEDMSVGIGVSSVHRDESFQACRFVIEEIKHRTPIWKKEFYEDGETDWVKGHALCQH